MSQMLFSPRDVVPVNAIRLFCRDQLARVAATGNGVCASDFGRPPAAGTMSNSQVPSARRLNKTWLPSGEKQGQKSWWPEVRNVIVEVALGGRGLAGESAGDDAPLHALLPIRAANFTQCLINDI